MSQDFASDFISLVDQRVQRGNTRLRALVVKDPYLALYNSGGSTNTWVVDVDVGGDNIVREAIVKAGSGNSRAYARRGQAVFLERSQNGRWMVIGPADRRLKQTTVIEVDQGNNNQEAAQPNEGFQVVDKPYDFFATVNPATGNVWYTESAYKNFRVLDGDGNEVT